MQHTTPKAIIMSTNGTAKTGIIFDWSSLIQGILSAGVLTCIGFLIKVNSTMAVMQDQRLREEQDRLELKQSINKLELKVQEVNERTIRLERDSKTN